MYGPFEMCVKKSDYNSNVEDNQNTIILEDKSFLKHIRALANQISLKNAYLT